MSKTLGEKMGTGGLSLGGSSGKIYVPTGDKKTFRDVAGQEEAKEALREVVDYLSHPEKVCYHRRQVPQRRTSGWPSRNG